MIPVDADSNAATDSRVALGGPRGPIAGWERIVVGLLFVAALALDVVWRLYAHFDSDEPQHLHVVWAWVHGLLPYRDVFDNHTPLFHVLCVPLYLLFGQRPDLLIWMRLALLPLYVAAVWMTYRIGRSLYSPRVGLWSAAIVSVSPEFFRMTAQFRPCILWTILWLGAVLGVLAWRQTPWRRFATGLLLGAAVGVSLKSTLMLAALGGAGAMLALICREELSLRGLAKRLGKLAPMAAGMAIIPGAIVAYFLARHATGAFVYAVVTHNVVPGAFARRCGVKALTALPAGLIGLYLLGRITYQRRLFHAEARHVMLLLIVGLYWLLLLTTWPAVTMQDYPPILPLTLILLVAIVDALAARVSPHLKLGDGSKATAAAALLAIVIEVAFLVSLTPRRNQTRADVAMWADLLRLTSPGDTVMDRKGQLVFRPRGYFHVLETMTLWRLQQGLLADTIPQSLVASKTCVASQELLPKRAERFVQDNYLSVGSLRVAGKFLRADAAAPRATIAFTVAIPAIYRLITPRGPAAGRLDGRPCGPARYLKPGRHEYDPSAGESIIALVWAQAIDRGFEPVWPGETRP